MDVIAPRRLQLIHGFGAAPPGREPPVGRQSAFALSRSRSGRLAVSLAPVGCIRRSRSAAYSCVVRQRRQGFSAYYDNEARLPLAPSVRARAGAGRSCAFMKRTGFAARAPLGFGGAARGTEKRSPYFSTGQMGSTATMLLAVFTATGVRPFLLCVCLTRNICCVNPHYPIFFRRTQGDLWFVKHIDN